MEPTAEQVEAFLDSNEQFTKRYFEKKTTPAMVEYWMSQHSYKPSSRMAINRQSVSLSERKISGRCSLLAESSTDIRASMLFGRSGSPKQRQSMSFTELSKLDEKDKFMELIRDIANELDINRLSHKILVNVSVLTNADRGSLFLTHGSKENRVLVSKLFDVTTASSVEESIQNEDDQIVVPFGKGIAGCAAESGEAINIKDAYSDPRFNRDVDKKTGYTTHSILCMPIKNHEDEVLGVAQMINKKSGSHQFTEKDEEVFKDYLTFCAIGITNAQLFETSELEFKRNQVLLQLAKSIFEEQTNVDDCVNNIIVQAQALLQCERCMVFLIDDSPGTQGVVFSKAFDIQFKEDEDAVLSTPSSYWSVDTGIAFWVATSGQVVNIPDAYSDDRFSPEADQASGFVTKSILCMPIYNREQNIIGVVQLMNKLDGKPFSESDESIFEAFAIFCGLGINNTKLYEEACKLLTKQKVAMEVLSYHASAQPAEVHKILKKEIPSAEQLGLYAYEFNDMVWGDEDTILASMRMFMELDTFRTFHVLPETMCRWLLSVKKNYRPVKYHNWRHAFNVAQSMFTIMKTGSLCKYFSDLEVFALIVACLCHDLDHRGTNNAFQTKTDSPLAALYSTSTMEHHHFDHCIMILNGEGNNIFSEMSPEEYRDTIKILEHAILSTDLALYFKKRGTFQEILAEPNVDWSADNNRELLRAMMMTACDVAAITKPWEIQRVVAEMVASEFFDQGDLEKEKLNAEPIPMMDRRKKNELPSMQVGFIDFICLPIYELFYKLEPSLKPLLDGCQSNRRHWQELGEKSMDDQAKNYSNSPIKERTRDKDVAIPQKKEEPTNDERNVRQQRQKTKSPENNNSRSQSRKTSRDSRKSSGSKRSEKKTSIERMKSLPAQTKEGKEKPEKVGKEKGKSKARRSKMCAVV